MKRYTLLILIALLVMVSSLSACGNTQLLENKTSQNLVLDSTGGGSSVSLSYAIGQPAKVWVYLEDAQGNRYTLRDGETRAPSIEPYTLRFDGTVPIEDDPELLRRSLPSGEYTYTILARAEGSGEDSQSGKLTVASGSTVVPRIENLAISPTIISPNADGIDDESQITYQLPVTATVNLSIQRPDGGVIPIVTDEEQEPILQRALWNGRTSDGAVLPNGVYTYTLRARDDFGNIVQRTGDITIVESGQPEAQITYSSIAPAAVELGGVITVTLRVKNTGDVPIRTYGPASGYEYSTNDVFSSIEGGQYVQKSGGFWRVGVDWDANGGGGSKRYPFRWAVSPRPADQWKIPFVEDELQPGEEAVVIGRIKIEQQEDRMGFYVGLTWDGVGFPVDRVGRQIVEVGF